MDFSWFQPHWLSALGGGVLIGFAALLLLLLNGQIAGISGILAGAIHHRHSWRLLFLLGLVAAGGAMLHLGIVATPDFTQLPALPVVIIAGLLVGIGTRIGNGCTSGHGICGIGRLSLRSIVATLTFMASGMLTVFITRHLF